METHGVGELNARIKRDANKTVSLFNPTNKDFKVVRDGQEFIVLAFDSLDVPLLQEWFVKKHLIDHVLVVRELKYNQHNRDLIVKEVEMNVGI